MGLPLEWIASGVSGRLYNHYFLTWLPLSAVVITLGGVRLVQRAEAAPGTMWRTRVRRCGPVGGILLCVLPLLYLGMLLQRPPKQQYADAIAYIEQHAAPQDTMLVWGGEASLHAITQRAAPSRFVYQYPLATCSYATTALSAAFMRDLQTQPPQVIIDASTSDTIMPPLDPAQRDRWAHMYDHCGILPTLQPIFDYVAAEYERVEDAGKWPVYRRRTAAPPHRRTAMQCTPWRRPYAWMKQRALLENKCRRIELYIV